MAYADLKNKLDEYNWDDGFEVPRTILADPDCDLALALEIFYLAGGYEYLEKSAKRTKLQKWNPFITVLLKAIQGKSALPQDVLSEMLEDARQKVLSSSERITELTAELNDGNSKIEEMKAEFNQIVSWSKIFDDSPMEVKKMICGYIIKKVSVCKDYDIKIEFNINVEQFLNGIDGVSECDTSELSIAQ